MAIAGGDSCRLLAAVLQREDSEIAEVADGLARGVDAKDATLLAGSTVIDEIPIRELTGK